MGGWEVESSPPVAKRTAGVSWLAELGREDDCGHKGDNGVFEGRWELEPSSPVPAVILDGCGDSGDSGGLEGGCKVEVEPSPPLPSILPTISG